MMPPYVGRRGKQCNPCSQILVLLFCAILVEKIVILLYLFSVVFCKTLEEGFQVLAIYDVDQQAGSNPFLKLME